MPQAKQPREIGSASASAVGWSGAAGAVGRRRGRGHAPAHQRACRCSDSSSSQAPPARSRAQARAGTPRRHALEVVAVDRRAARSGAATASKTASTLPPCAVSGSPPNAASSVSTRSSPSPSTAAVQERRRSACDNHAQCASILAPTPFVRATVTNFFFFLGLNGFVLLPLYIQQLGGNEIEIGHRDGPLQRASASSASR